jgi:Holliday junction resolvase RusA-like endonuclease
MIRFDIPGPPVGKGRPRATRANGFVSFYTPAKTRNYEKAVAMAGKMFCRQPLSGPLRMSLFVRMAVPASWSKRKREDALSGCLRPVSKPDLSNVLKAIEDGLNGICYRDDAQIVSLQAEMWYAPTPGVTVEINQS